MSVKAEIPCKQYVKTYLENRFGNLDPKSGLMVCLLSSDTIEGKFLFELLESQNERRDTEFGQYPQTVIVKITEDVFLRKGYFLSKTSTIRFNSFIEDLIKNSMRLIIATLVHECGMKMTAAIEKFQDTFGFDEKSFPLETIKKDLQRYKITGKGDLREKVIKSLRVSPKQVVENN
jgi:hypothetical protein